MDIFERIRRGDRGVSPVVGVALLVAIVVILGSMVAIVSMQVTDSAPSRMGTSAEIEGSVSGQYQITVTDMGRAETVELECGEASATIDSSGTTERIHDSSCEEILLVGVTEDGHREVLRRTAVEAFPRGGSSFPNEAPPDGGFTSYCDNYFKPANQNDDGAYIITVDHQLQCINKVDNATGWDYVLGNDIDASGTDSWDGGSGFDPIGESGAPFTGSFDGQGNEIRGLTIDRSGENYVGMFGSSDGDVIKNVDLRDITVTGGNRVGGLVGHSSAGTVDAVSVEGTIEASNYGGGVVGRQASSATVQNSDSTVDVTVSGTWDAGGLVGFNEGGTVRNSEADATVNGNEGVGGLVGWNEGTISDSSASATVDGEIYVGGLVGYTNDRVEESTVSATVTGSTEVGGFAGSNEGSVIMSSADADVTGSNEVGGFVGYTSNRIEESSVSATVTGSDRTGGFAGRNDGNVVGSSSDATVTGSLYVGGFVGYNMGQINNGSATGQLTGDDPDGAHLGGLVGVSTDASPSISESRSAVTVESVAPNTGGLVGQATSGTITNSVAEGDVSSTARQTGGLVGKLGDADQTGSDGNTVTVTESAAFGDVSSTGASTGGLIGRLISDGTIQASYVDGSVSGNTNVGGLIGAQSGGSAYRSYAATTVTASDSSESGGAIATVLDSGDTNGLYWDTDIGPSDTAATATGLTTDELSGTSAESNMSEFDFADTWNTVSGDYPVHSTALPE